MRRAVVAASLAVVAGGACQSADERMFTGIVTTEVQLVDEEGVVAYGVELVGSDYEDATVVTVVVPADRLRCADGAVVYPEQVALESPVGFVGPVGDDTPSIESPTMRGRDFTVEC